MGCIRETIENNEKLILCQQACLSTASKGREKAEEKCDIRTDFQRDRDRIIHSDSFRRLKHKTQVFVAPEGDHYRTRLTHTLEVSQIARTVARALRLNEDLTEAIALGHDLGHTPFGHAGERVLDECLETGFKHYEQSTRVCDRLEKSGRGLNLTYEVLNGILCHTNMKADTLEGRIVRYADVIAYVNHDIDDACKGSVMCEEDIPHYIREAFGFSKSERIGTMVRLLIENSGDDIRIDAEHQALFDELKQFMFDRVYTNPVAKGQETKAQEMLRMLFNYYSAHIEALPKKYRIIADCEGGDRASADYISGMTDRFAVYKFKELFMPKSWMVY